MSSSTFYDNIQRNLLLYSMELEMSNSSGLSSTSVHAENVFLRLFNMIFGWELVNGNAEKMNQNGYDLIDLKRNLYIQITANKTYKKKIDYSLSQMHSVEKAEGAELIIFFIRQKITPSHKKKSNLNGLNYCAADIKWLLKEILQRCDAKALAEIDTFLRVELAPLKIQLAVHSSAIPDGSLMQELIPEKDGFYVQRNELVKNIFEFSQQDNGLLVGGPGFGKSFIIDALQRYYYQQNIPCYVLRINELIDGDLTEINENLGFTDGWLDKLALISSDDKQFKSLLIFDGLDTAKNERLKDKVFKYIRSALKRLKGSWNILVGCRTYDAAKSISLQLLFPGAGFDSGILGCRNIEIPCFSEQEVKDIFSTYPKMGEKVKGCTENLLKLLSVPYFMGLLEQIVNHGTDEKLNLSVVTTESQLLNFYWRIKIQSNRALDLFAHKITSAFAGIPSLSIETYNIVAAQDAVEFEELLKQGIIVEHGLHRKNISFAHNILLEYAVSYYLLYNQANKQIDFISSNNRLPFLFRQSFVYFYNDLWHYNRDLFWDHYFQIKAIKEPLFRLFHQTILDYVIIDTYISSEDLKPLAEELGTLEYGESVRRILESLWFINKGNVRLKDVIFLTGLCDKLHPDLLWQLGVHLEAAIRFYSKNNNDIMTELSKASREYMSYVMKERLVSDQKKYIDSNAGYRGIKNLCSTFSFEPGSAENILKNVLELLGEDDFPITFFHTLGECLEQVFASNAQFGADIYRKIYYHRETSNKVTSMGTAVLQLNSNRKQDFAHNYFVLEKKFKELLQINFLPAATLGADIVNKANAEGNYKPEKNIFSVCVGAVEASILLDNSYYEKDEKNGPFAHGRMIFEALELKTALEEQKIIQNRIYEIASVIQAAYLWRRLLKYLNENIALFQVIVFEILSNKIFFESDETMYEAVSLLERAWPSMTNTQRRKIEEIFFKLMHPEPFYHNELWMVSRLKKILSVIPPSTLQLAASIEFLDRNGVTENKQMLSRGLQMAQSQSLTQEERMAGYGFMPNNQEQSSIYELFKIVEGFNETFRKNEQNKQYGVLNEEEFEAAYKLFQSARSKMLGVGLIQASCDNAVATFANILSAHPQKISDEKTFFLREVSMYYISIDDYKSKTYEQGELSSRFGGAYSPSARTASVLTLINLMYDSKDPSLEETVLALMSDNMAIIRLKALPALSYFWNVSKVIFWEKVFERVAAESDGLCMNEIITKLCFDDLIKCSIENIEKVSLLIAERLSAEDGETYSEIWSSYVVLQLMRVLRHDRQSAVKGIKDNLKNKEFSRTLIFEINGTLDSFNAGKNYIENLDKFSVLIDLYKEVLKFRFDFLKTLGISHESAVDHFEIVDNVIQNIHFILDFENNNGSRKLSKVERKALSSKLMPLLEYAAVQSEYLESGFMVAHTGFYFMKNLNFLIDFDPQRVLELSAKVVICAAKNGFTYDQSTLKEVVKLTESLIADHKKVLSISTNFDKLIIILDQFAQSGSQEALQLTWSLKDAF
ncbi:SMEK domain-containing protein [Flavobacterium sp. GA093]|uniref:SMEK domain-containing protein n=1 Tax=Flavobacterium hydrocarbonoxydans TaxID=2683249 RepID=A0A6I4NLI7_9FLAO|nr:SMEK domain-containing protein [Flavobacterium hydrocarbonoxydans]MWB95021.1 SMEK domain-containing protein [Flavobacterium hydrocarbonoxydans]